MSKPIGTTNTCLDVDLKAVIVRGRIGLGFLFLIIVFFSSVANGDERCMVLGLDEAVTVAIETNPRISSIRHEVEGEKALVGPAGALPDPILGIGFLNLPTDTFTLDQEGMTQTQIKLTQKLPFPGKLPLKQTIQGLKAQAMEWRLDAAITDLKRDVKSTFWELFRIAGHLSLLKKEESTLSRIIELSVSKYESGTGLQSDVLLAQLELARLLDKRIDLESRYRDAIHGLKKYLGISEGCIEIKKDVKTHLVELPAMDELVRQALEGNPGIRELKAILELKRHAYKLTKKSIYPDFSVTSAYGKRFGDNPDGSGRADFVSLLFTMNVPIFYKKKQSLDMVAALEEVRSAQAGLDARMDQVREKLQGKYAVYVGLLDEDRLYRNIMIPKARATLKALKAAYTQGRADIVGLLRAELMLYRFEESHIDVISRANKVKAVIESLAGRDL